MAIQLPVPHIHGDVRPSIRFARCGLFPALVFALLAAGCVSPQYGPTARVKAIDRLAEIHEQYGSVTLSPPILIPPGDSTDYFKFDLSITPKDYFDHAKTETQGKAAVSSSVANVSSVGFGLQANLDQISMGKELWSQYFTQQNDYARQKAAYEASQAAVNNIKLEAARIKLKAALEEAKKKGSEADRAAAMEDAYAQFAQDIPQPPAPGSAPELPKLDNSQLPELDKSLSDLPPDAKAFLQADKFAKQLDLLGADQGGGSTNRDRTAIVTAAGDKTIEGIFRALGQVDKIGQFEDKVALYGIAMVSVQPGWRTRHDFEANLAAWTEIQYKPARESLDEKFRKWLNDPLTDKKVSELEKSIGKLDDTVGKLNERVTLLEKGEKNTSSQNSDYDIKQNPLSLKSIVSDIGEDTPSGGDMPGMDASETCKSLGSKPLPAIAAVSPMTDIQNLDSASSQRQAIERAQRIGLALSFLGAKTGVSAFNDYASKLESDIRTRTPLVPVASYSNGGVFGYRIGPSVAALTNPGDPKSASGELLQKQSFPVLLIIGLDKSDLAPRNTDKDGKPLMDKDGMPVVCEPSLDFEQTPSWVPMNEQAAENRLKETELVSIRETIELTDIQNEIEAAPEIEAEKNKLNEKLNVATAGEKTKLKARIKKLDASLNNIAKHKKNFQHKLGKGIFSFMYSDEDDYPETTGKLMKLHETTLKRLVLGLGATQDIPDLIFEKYLLGEKDLPTVNDVYIAGVKQGEGKIEGQIILTGKDLDSIACEGISDVLPQDPTGFKLKPKPNCNGIIVAGFEVGLKGGVVMLRLPLMDEKKQATAKTILTPPIMIAAAAEEPKKEAPPSKAKALVYTVGQDNGVTTHRIEFQNNINEKEIGSAKEVLRAELEKNKPGPPEPPSQKTGKGQ